MNSVDLIQPHHQILIGLCIGLDKPYGTPFIYGQIKAQLSKGTQLAIEDRGYFQGCPGHVGIAGDTAFTLQIRGRLCDRIAIIVGGKIVRTGSVAGLIEEVQQERIVQFTLAQGSLLNLREETEKAFPGFRTEILSANTLRIHSPREIDLMPFMRFFAARGLKVTEARLLRPSLEEAFVRLTGLELAEMKKEKEGGGKK